MLFRGLKLTKFIAIASSKGGVGKTTAAINLGTALANFGKDVVVMDADLSNPNVSMHLGSPKLGNTLHEALKGKIHVTDAAYLHPSGLRIIPGNISLDILKEIGENELNNFKNILIDMIGTTDLVLIDTGAGLSKENMSVIKAADEMIAITSPDVASVADTMKTIKISEDNGCKVIGVIINRTTPGSHDMSIESIQAMLDKNILGIVPEDISVRKSIAARQPLVYLYPDSAASIGFKKIAANMLGQDYSHKIH